MYLIFSFPDCGGLLTNKGSISTTNYPSNYNMNQDCEWLLEVPPEHTMTITIADIDLFESENCTHTELTVRVSFGMEEQLQCFILNSLPHRFSMASKGTPTRHC